MIRIGTRRFTPDPYTVVVGDSHTVLTSPGEDLGDVR